MTYIHTQKNAKLEMSRTYETEEFIDCTGAEIITSDKVHLLQNKLSVSKQTKI